MGMTSYLFNMTRVNILSYRHAGNDDDDDAGEADDEPMTPIQHFW